ncbi:nitrite reductase small subunit NirD [Paenibacillus lycopersici]|uniref:Nitrite reductase small subunit NirD n=1 Tax=Paenibacillus lycopersici TaxID=2704462 RepID=A0A6C0G1K2_9BACL|nr:nitrite reductase small subunit NirD [Paenibacillus lycopersici]QHT61541.1 nitrite reductase small subunit NirD [Paenibacillus lycopersici]
MNEYVIGHVSQFSERRGRIVRIGELELALFKQSDGTVTAIENRCPHKGGKLSEGMVCGSHVYCPLHDWKIDLNDGLVQAPDDGCVQRFPVFIDEHENVILRMALSKTKVS